MPQAVQLRAGEDGIIDILFARGTLFHLYIGRWTGNKKLRARDLLIDSDVDAAALHIGHKKLMPPAAHARIQRVDSRARAFLDNKSLPFPLGNSRYVPYAKLQEVLTGLRAFVPEWNEAVDFLISNYEQFKNEQLERLSLQNHALADAELSKLPATVREQRRTELEQWETDQHQLNRALYPTAEQLRLKFVFEWRMFKISPLEGVSEMTGLDADTVASEHRRVVDASRQFVREAAAMLHQELGEAAAHAKDLLQENGKLTARSLRPLFEAFETFQSLSFGTSDAQATIEAIRSRYLRRMGDGSTNWELTADLVNSAKDDLHSLLNTISSYAVAETAEAAGLRSIRSGEFGRVLDL